jgi:hypothetical protein
VDDFEKYPPAPYWETSDFNGRIGMWTDWQYFLRAYTGLDPTRLICPSEMYYGYNTYGTATETEQAVFITNSLGLGGFPFPVAESSVLVPTEMIALLHRNTYGTHLGFGWPGALWKPELGGKSFHQGGDLAAFCDGHVESSKAELIPKEAFAWYDGRTLWRFKPTEAYTKRWNRNNQPHPETWRPVPIPD